MKRVCLSCGEEFYSENKKRKYCTRKCYNKLYEKQNRKRLNKYNQKAKCIKCGKPCRKLRCWKCTGQEKYAKNRYGFKKTVFFKCPFCRKRALRKDRKYKLKDGTLRRCYDCGKCGRRFTARKEIYSRRRGIKKMEYKIQIGSGNETAH